MAGGCNAAARLIGGRKPKICKVGKGDVAEEQIETFFATLADTCNVARSARAAGFAASFAYRRRKNDAAFRSAWSAAVREGYAKLELMLLERAMKGTPKLVRTSGGNDRVMREYSNSLAVALLKRHADFVETQSAEPDADALAEVRERILAKLEALRAREEQSKGAIETKGRAATVEIIAWAVARLARDGGARV